MPGLKKQSYFYFLLLFFLAVSARGQNLRKIDSLEEVVAKSTHIKQQVSSLLLVAAEYEYSDQMKALLYADKAEKMALESSYYPGYCGSLLQAAKIYYIHSDLKNGMDCAVKAKETAESQNLKAEEALAMDAIGMMFYEIGDEHKSSACFFSSLRIYEGLKDSTGIGSSLCRIGTLYYNQKDNQKAVDYYNRSMQIAKGLKNFEGIASNLNNLASVYTSERDYKRALVYYQQALKINQEMENPQLEGSNYLNIGNLYMKMSNYNAAMVSVQHALDIFTQLGNNVRIAKSRLTMGDILLAMNQYDSSLENASIALVISRENGFKEQLKESAALLHKVYLAKKDTTAAYRYAMLEQQWNDSLLTGEKQKTLAKLDLQYQFEKKEQRLKAEKQRRNYFIVILGMGIVFSIIILFLVRARYRLKEKESHLEKKNLEMDLDFKKKELTLHVMSLMKKNEMISGIAKKIIQIEKNSQQDETRHALKQVARELQKGTEEEILKEFSKRFKEVHSDFYDKLLKAYPTLTPSELKLSAFLRLNMTTKEIADLTGQQIATLENARYRLRQKLGITSTDVNLVTFLSQI